MIIINNNTISDTRSIDNLYHFFSEYSHLDSHVFIEADHVKDSSFTGKTADTIKSIARKIWLEDYSFLFEKTDRKLFGFEIWCNSIPKFFYGEHGKHPQKGNILTQDRERDPNDFIAAGDLGGTSYHLDKDEGEMDSNDELVSPIFSTVLFIGPKDGINGGQLMINTKGLDHYNSYDGGLIDLGENKGWVEVPFEYNRLVIFDSSFPHFVKPIISLPERAFSRATLAINVWDRTPVDFRGQQSCEIKRKS